jgi:hypothetical protein
MCHVPPLVLALYQFVGHVAMPWLHVVVDLLTAWLLAQCVHLHRTIQARELEEERAAHCCTTHKNTQVQLPEHIHPHLPAIAAAMYPLLLLLI